MKALNKCLSGIMAALCATVIGGTDSHAQMWHNPVGTNFLVTTPSTSTLVGIGTTVPRDYLHIHGSGSQEARIRFSHDECNLAGQLYAANPQSPSHPEAGDIVLRSSADAGCGHNIVLWAENYDDVDNHGQIRFWTGEGEGMVHSYSEKATITSDFDNQTGKIYSIFDLKARADFQGNPVMRFYQSDPWSGDNLNPTQTWSIGPDVSDNSSLKFAPGDDPSLSAAEFIFKQNGQMGIGDMSP